MAQPNPAEVFAPGEFLKEELEARGWSQTDLAEVLGRSVAAVNEVISAKRRITPETAKGLAAALGTSPELWMNLEAAYQLDRVRDENSDPIARRARLYSYAPVKEMLKRGWIESSNNVDLLEKQVADFFGVPDFEHEPPVLAHAARRPTYGPMSTAQRAWLVRVQQVALGVEADEYSDDKLRAAIDELRQLMEAPQELRHVPRILSRAGIRLVVVEALQGTKIDGACLWLNSKSPVIALTLRHNRIDNCWWVLMHEVAHVLLGHGITLDSDLEGTVNDSSKPETERAADEFASGAIIPPDRLESFIARVKPLYSTERIVGFARIVGVHPGLVVGQLHHRREVVFANFRRMLVPIREVLTAAARTDGWGASAPVPI